MDVFYIGVMIVVLLYVVGICFVRIHSDKRKPYTVLTKIIPISFRVLTFDLLSMQPLHVIRERNGSSDPRHVWFQGRVFGVGGSNGDISRWTKCNSNIGENNARGEIRLVTI